MSNYYQDVYDQFTVGMLKDAKVILLVDYCQRRAIQDTLLFNLHQERPTQVTTQFNYTPPSTTHHPPPTSPRNPRQIFISHAHQDADFAQKLADDLEVHGWHIWIAPDSILPGEHWVQAIERGLDESTIFLVLMTPDAVKSKWVRKESNLAIGLEMDEVMQFIPLLVKSCQKPTMWRAYQHISFTRNRYDAGLTQLVQRLNTAPVGSRHALTLPEQPVRDETPEPVAETPTREPRIEVVQPPAPKPLIPDYLLPAGNPSQYKILSENRILWLKDGKEMVLIPTGKFLYGKDKQELELPAFWMDRTPVTNEEYKRFIDVNPSYKVPSGRSTAYSWDEKKRLYPQGKERHPVVYVSWHDAQAYAEWAGKVLPTEQQWEKAARGTDGRKYPWGNEWKETHCNSREAGIGGTSPVGQFSPQGDSPYGCVDLSGNVWEWTDSWWNANQGARVLRGGSWDGNNGFARADFRIDFRPHFRNYSFGFRVCSPIHSGS